MQHTITLRLTIVALLAAGPATAQELSPAPSGGPSASTIASSVPKGAADALWKRMYDARMIDFDQYQYVSRHGQLPPGTAATDSPLQEKRQRLWMDLRDSDVVSADELAHILFKGTLPGMAEWEIKAFEDLVPVYEPDHRKRLAYDVRRKHIVVDMIRLKHRSSKEWEKSHAEALEWAGRTGSPVKGETAHGRFYELMHMGVHGEPIHYVTLNANAAKTISTDAVRPGGATSFDLTGTNILAAIWEGEGLPRTNHVEFPGRVRLRDEVGLIEHATAVAGTLVAAGLNPNAQGMAPSGRVDAYYWDDLLAELSDCVASNPGIQLSNHSYGVLAGWRPGGFLGFQIYWNGDIAVSETEDWHFGYYGGIPRGLDEFCVSAMYHLPVYGAGNDRNDDYDGRPDRNYAYHDTSRGDANDWFWRQYSSYPIPSDGGSDGFDTMLPHAVAKNVLAVGSVNDLPNGYSNGVTVTLAGYSTFGPTDDGRIKPDLVANGQGVYSTYTTGTNGYGSESGTSFAAPSVTGSMMLLQELHERSFGTEQPMLASTMKALAIHTADDIGETGPDYKFGWGLMNTENAAWVITNNASWDSLPHIKEVLLQDGEYVEFDVLASTNVPLKATICWTDPPGTIPPYECDPTNLMLVNDLDLSVLHPGGGTSFPWVIDPAAPTNAATTGDNFRDNVEQVAVSNPTNDWYTIRVMHKGSLSNGCQDVSIIVTGNTPATGPDFTFTDAGVVGSNGLVQLHWPGVVGALYSVEASTNLLVSNGWTEIEATVSANVELMKWVDANAADYAIRFYRLKRTK